MKNSIKALLIGALVALPSIAAAGPRVVVRVGGPRVVTTRSYGPTVRTYTTRNYGPTVRTYTTTRTYGPTVVRTYRNPYYYNTWVTSRPNYTYYSRYYPAAGYRVRVVPPAPQYEVVTTSPGSNYHWVRGHYGWNGYQYVWISGYWSAYRPGQRWVDARWDYQNGDYVYQPGEYVSDQPTYGQPVYSQPTYGQPTYVQPQPVYTQPTYTQPTYAQPTYVQNPAPQGFNVSLGGLGISASVGVNVAPPNTTQDVMTPAPGAGHQWQSGFWHWNGSQYQWVPGRWVQTQYRWQPARWELVNGQYYFRQGQWVR